MRGSSIVADSGDIAEVIGFWFGPGMNARWFKKDPAFDAEVRARLGAPHQAAAAGALGAWRESAEGCLALIVILDQVPRNLFRGQARAFATDAAAREIVVHALAQGFEAELTQCLLQGHCLQCVRQCLEIGMAPLHNLQRYRARVLSW